MLKSDWNTVADIYKQGIETGIATFQQEVPTWKEWDAAHIQQCRIVSSLEGEIVGWAALSAVSKRPVYAGVAEVSIYISSAHRGLKIGRKLLEELIMSSEKEGFWTLQSGIIRGNEASVKLHADLGFRQIGYREKVGKMNGIWWDTLLFERRSTVIGIE
jgi:L-amino acid N-acyltransferase YncA